MMRYSSTSMEKRELEADPKKYKKRERKASMEKRELEADPKKYKKRERKADPKKRKKNKKREREADPKKKKNNKKREREADSHKSKKRKAEADPDKKQQKKKRQREEEEDPKSSNRSNPWEGIPHHLLELFLKPLETAERPNLSRVCKAWGELKPPPLCFPEIVLGSIFKFFFRGDEVDKYLLRSMLGSSHGWLIIRFQKKPKDFDDFDKKNEQQLYYLLNLVTKDTIRLPILWNHNPHYPKIILSSEPTDPDCIALMFDSSFRGFLFSKRGSNKWFESQCEYPLYSYPDSTADRDYLYDAAIVLLEGRKKIYALSLQGKLVALDIDVSDLHHPTATLTVLPVNSIKPSSTRYNQCMRLGFDCYLVESLGKLLVVRLFRQKIDADIKDVDVLELDFKTMSWSKVKSLPGDDQVLFVGLDSSFSISGSKIGITSSSNCIYVYDDLLCKISKYDMHSEELMVCRVLPQSEELDNYGRVWVRPTSV